MTKHIPDGFHSVTPHLVVKDPEAAIKFYQDVFGASEIMPALRDPSGKIVHAELKIGDSQIMLAGEVPQFGNLSPETFGGTPVVIALYVEDVDEVTSRAAAAGAKVLKAPSDQFYGDRAGRIEDPFGHVWGLATHIEDVSPDEVQKRMAALYGG